MKPTVEQQTVTQSCHFGNEVTQREFLLDALSQFEQPLTSYALRLTGNDWESAKDAVQHSFMKLCEQMPEKIRPKLAPWLYTVCRNRIIDELKVKQRATASDPGDFDNVDPKAWDPADRVEKDDFLRQLRIWIAGLPKSEQEVIDLWSHGLNANEIADVLKRRAGTVRVHLHRAIKKLRQRPEVANWLERATGQDARSDVDAEIPANASPKVNVKATSTASMTGERS